MERKVPKYENHKLRERKGKLLPEIEEITKRQAHGNCIEIFRLAWPCSQTFTLFRLRKMAVPVEISRYSFRVFVCACPFVISSIPGKSFTFLSLNLWFSYFGTFLSTWSKILLRILYYFRINMKFVLLQMSAGSQIQMAPQATVNSGQPVHSQDSNMSTGKFINHNIHVEALRN